MTLLGIKTLIYGVDDLAECTRFYDDFGLPPAGRSDSEVRYELPEGSSFILRRGDDPALPARGLDGPGPREIVWGVDTEASLAAIAADLGTDREVTQDSDGTLHTRDDSGLAIGFALFDRKPLPVKHAAGENNLGDVTRWDQHRTWYDQARPKLINHVVFGVPDVDKAVAFYTGRLGFRVSDIMRGFGMFMRCDGRHDHHNLFLFKMPKMLFSHVSFGVETIDELMIGANQMQRQGWNSNVGLGRHRISSLIFYYLNSPAGGQTEYSADSDYLTDDWKPRLWDAEFGQHHWLSTVTKDTKIANKGEIEILHGPIPKLSETVRAPKA